MQNPGASGNTESLELHSQKIEQHGADSCEAFGIAGEGCAGIVVAFRRQKGLPLLQRLARRFGYQQRRQLHLATASPNTGFIPTTFTAKYDPVGQTGEGGLVYRGSLRISPVNAIENNADYTDSMRLITVRVDWESPRISFFMISRAIRAFL